MVCANVLRIKMPESDSSMRVFTFWTWAPDLGRILSKCSRYAGVMESSTASKIEHRKDTPMAMVK